ncbi:MAG: tRNA (adenine(22)-N(1))-methyltransferase TrmK [Prevotellaceae bacterium]|jgi:tRNA1Val (adenine37-N6)-methyltransferase|nr:tRNA (adenine(22)-N(1))-methyltransferase TrmK [Prevotellaceae bacterium]
MSNDYFKFKQFTVRQDKTAMKVGVDSVLLGSWISVNGSEKNVLDIGSGTGLLALMMAQKIPAARIIACEIDGNACRQASGNISAAGWSERITVVNADIKTYTQNSGSFDLIICNPPYFEKSLKSQDSKRNFARHSDSLSLSDLTDCVDRLLSNDGRFALIVPADKAGTVTELAGNKKLFPIRRLNVKSGETKPVNRVIMEFSRIFRPPEENTLTVRAGNCYSDEYKSLTKDFYLLF